MAFGFPAYHAERIQLDVDRQIVREAVSATLDQLGWRYENPYPDSFSAKIPLNGFSWGEKLTISFSADGDLEITSECSPVPQIFDWGKNKRNVEEFLAIFTTKAAWIARLRNEDERFDTAESTPLERALTEDAS